MGHILPRSPEHFLLLSGRIALPTVLVLVQRWSTPAAFDADVDVIVNKGTRTRVGP